jgi:L-serine dehydratase
MYSSIAEILEQSGKNKKAFWEVVMEADMESRDVSREESRQKMEQLLDVMRDADQSYEGELKSASGLSGGDGKLLEDYNQAGKNLCGFFMGKVMERAIKMGESNACMKRIVAAPTAGSCGVIPAVLLSYEEYRSVPKDELINAM